VAPLLVEGLKPSLVSKGIGAEGARQLHVALWGNDPGDNVFMDLKNKTRSELKHLSSGAPLTIGLEQECIRMLDRAVENYRLLHKRSATFVVQYERRAVARSPQAKAS
jgi:hypothetical protein